MPVGQNRARADHGAAAAEPRAVGRGDLQLADGAPRIGRGIADLHAVVVAEDDLVVLAAEVADLGRVALNLECGFAAGRFIARFAGGGRAAFASVGDLVDIASLGFDAGAGIDLVPVHPFGDLRFLREFERVELGEQFVHCAAGCASAVAVTAGGRRGRPFGAIGFAVEAGDFDWAGLESIAGNISHDGYSDKRPETRPVKMNH